MVVLPPRTSSGGRPVPLGELRRSGAGVGLGVERVPSIAGRGRVIAGRVLAIRELPPTGI